MMSRRKVASELLSRALALEGYAPLFRPETSFTPVRGHRLHIGGA